MSTAVTLAIVNGAYHGRRVIAVPACEKTASNKDYLQDEPREDASARQRSDKRRKGKTYRNGTRNSVPNWDRPRLSPTFAAQVIGQGLGSERNPVGAASAEAAYRAAARMRTPSLDESI